VGTESKPKAAPGTAARAIGQDTVVVAPKTGKVFVLNRTGGLIWGLCDGSRSVDELAGSLVAQFGISPQQARSDVQDLLQALAERQLIEMV
jgi:hypothetical protein